MKPRLSHRLQYGLIFLLARALYVLPRRARGLLGATLGQIACFIGIRKAVVSENLKRAFPGIPKIALRVLRGRVYRHWGAVSASFGGLPRLSVQDVGRSVHLANPQALSEALAEGNGCIVVSGHLGNWELMGAIEALRGTPVSFVVTTQRNKQVERMIDRYRESNGIEIIKRREAVRGVLQALKRNRAVAILIDQDAHEDGAFVPFFGQLASTPRGPAIFHLRTRAPIVFARCTRLPGEKYRIQYQRVKSSTSDADQLTAELTAILESAIRETPEQWLWMHRRWKTAPPAFSS